MGSRSYVRVQSRGPTSHFYWTLEWKENLKTRTLLKISTEISTNLLGNISISMKKEKHDHFFDNQCKKLWINRIQNLHFLFLSAAQNLMLCTRKFLTNPFYKETVPRTYFSILAPFEAHLPCSTTVWIQMNPTVKELLLINFSADIFYNS